MSLSVNRKDSTHSIAHMRFARCLAGQFHQVLLLYFGQQQRLTMAPANSNESYCTFTLASDVTAGGLPSEEEIAKDLESTDDNVR